MLTARGWATPQARRLARAGALAAEHPTIATAWAAGLITADHVDAVARHAETFTAEELAAVLRELTDHWGRWSPAAITRFVAAAARMLHPPPGRTPAATRPTRTHSRDLSFAVLGDTVVLTGALPRLEGEAVIAAIDALAEKLRSTADHVPAGARRADALVELVNTAAATGTLPTRGGLPIALTVTLDHTTTGDPIWTTSRGHHLTPAETQFVACDPTLTPILLTTTTPEPPAADPDPNPGTAPPPPQPRHPRARPRPRTGSPPWPRCSSADPATPWPSDGPPGPPPPPNAKPWPPATTAASSPAARSPPRTAKPTTSPTGPTPAPPTSTNLALLCWAHHRQVDLRMWTIHPTPDGHQQPPQPHPGAPPGTTWPANNGAPFTITRTPRPHWRS